MVKNIQASFPSMDKAEFAIWNMRQHGVNVLARKVYFANKGELDVEMGVIPAFNVSEGAVYPVGVFSNMDERHERQEVLAEVSVDALDTEAAVSMLASQGGRYIKK